MFETGTGFEVLDRQFDGGVLAMEPVNLDGIAIEVSEERVMAPVGPQFLLRFLGETGPANDHATRDSLGMAKDVMAAKPMVLYESDDLIALASEEVAIRSIFPHEIDTYDPYEGEVRVWKT